EEDGAIAARTIAQMAAMDDVFMFDSYVRLWRLRDLGWRGESVASSIREFAPLRLAGPVPHASLFVAPRKPVPPVALQGLSFRLRKADSCPRCCRPCRTGMARKREA